VTGCEWIMSNKMLIRKADLANCAKVEATFEVMNGVVHLIDSLLPRHGDSLPSLESFGKILPKSVHDNTAHGVVRCKAERFFNMVWKSTLDLLTSNGTFTLFATTCAGFDGLSDAHRAALLPAQVKLQWLYPKGTIESSCKS
jgi:hypothetical protein